MATDRERCLGEMIEALAAGESQLQGDQIFAGDHFGHGMFNLNAGVHLQKEEFEGRGIYDELDGTGTGISLSRRECHRRFGHAVAHGRRQSGGGGFLDHFLETPLQRAIALKEMHRAAIAETEDLDFDMPRLRDETLQKHCAIPE